MYKTFTRFWRRFLKFAKVRGIMADSRRQTRSTRRRGSQTDAQFWSNQPDPLLIERGHADAIRLVRRFSAIIRYMFLNACRDRIVSSVPRYLNLCWNNSVSGNLGSRPNMIKNGLSRECSLGRKLYAAVARVHTLSHSTLGLTCLAKHVFKKA